MVICARENPAIDSGQADISPLSYELFQKYLSECCGITLGANKHYLVANRLNRVLGRSGLSSLDLLISRFCSGQLSTTLVAGIIDAMTTNETFWFREPAHFTGLAEQIQVRSQVERQPGMFSIWSAACSTGQEPYSISMAIENLGTAAFGEPAPVIQILGTDISDSVIDIARRGVYGDYEIQRGLNANDRARFFQQNGNDWRVVQKIRSRVAFKSYNLLDPYQVLGRFDVIFCRNVLIYFPETVKRDILARMARVLKPEGLLYLSQTESMPAELGCYEAAGGAPVGCYRLCDR